MSLRLRTLPMIFLLSFAVVAAFTLSNSPALGNIGPALSATSTTTTSTSSSFLTTLTSETTTTTLSTTQTTSTSTTSTSTTTSFSYTATTSATFTSISFITSYTGTVTTTIQSTITSISIAIQRITSTTSVVSTSTTSAVAFPTCPVAFVTNGSPLEPQANFLRGFRNNQIMNTTAGRQFMATFNSWYYSWAPTVARFAESNPWFANALRIGVYPLLGILYASYFSYSLAAPLSPELGSVMAGAVAASLIGLVYVAPVAYVFARFSGLHKRKLRRLQAIPAAAWLAASGLFIAISYLTGSALMMGLATASLALSALSLGSILGAMALVRVNLPIPVSVPAMTLAMRRVIGRFL